jgi:SAM-dependent methyltransferase
MISASRIIPRVKNLYVRANSARQKNGITSVINLACRKLWFSLEGAIFDLSHGVDTNGLVLLKELMIDSSNRKFGYRYQATPPRLLRERLRWLPFRLEEFTFVDLGSGKGRPLLIASEFPFRRIIGVEFSPALHAIAVENLGRFRFATQRCRDVQSVCADAAAYEFPIEPTVLYFFHPFDESMMQRVLGNIGRSLQQNPRDFWILYYNPVLACMLDEAGFLSRCDLTNDFGVYRSRILSADMPSAGCS